MLVIHHTDNDGYCCAALAKNYLVLAYDVPADSDFIPYSHGSKTPQEILEREIRKDEKVYILDLALDDVIFDFIATCVSAGAEVIHIDHHKSTKDYIDNMGEVEKKIYSNVTQFFETSVSATMLTYAYSMFNDEERKSPNDIYIGNSSDYSALFINPNTPKQRQYHIPFVVRFVDDWDVWRFALDDTKAFNNGFFGAEYRNKPYSKEWHNLIYGDSTIIPKIVERGRVINDDRTALYKNTLTKAFETSIRGIQCLAINTTLGTSELFGDKIDDYPMCVIFHYNGTMNKWKFEFRSGEHGIDVSEMAKNFGGGGHFHAAGCECLNLIFDESIVKDEVDVDSLAQALEEV